MPTRNVMLTAHHEEVIERRVREGLHQNASEAPREGLRLVEARAAERSARLGALREAARRGFGAVDQGDYLAFDSFDDLERRLVEVAGTAMANGEPGA